MPVVAASDYSPARARPFLLRYVAFTLSQILVTENTTVI